MTFIPKHLLSVALALALSACTGSRQTEPITAEPVYNKFGAVEVCVGSDGRTYQPRPELADPCEPVDCPNPEQIPGTNIYTCPPPPEDCPNGFFSASGEYICPIPDRGNDSSSTNDRGRTPGPNDPTGAGTPNAPGG